MALTANEYKLLIVREVNDEDNVVAAEIDAIWALYSDKASAYLQYLYAKRKALDFLMGHVRKRVTTILRGGDVQAADSDLMGHLDMLRKVVQGEIDEIEAGTVNIGGAGWGKTPARA